MPGDPIDVMVSANPDITAEDVARLKKLHGLDRPIYERYWHWFSDLLAGDLGYSRTYNVPVSQILAPRLGNTVLLSFFSLFLSLVVAIPLGVLAALKKGGKLDYLANFLAFTGISVPSFWLGIVLIMFFSITLKWLPAGGTHSIAIQQMDFWGVLKDRTTYLILPALSLMTLQLGSFVRYTRSAMSEVLGHDYIRTAHAKGAPYLRVVFVHAFKNALIPLITVVSLSFSHIFSGAIITETIFAYQGVGKLVYDSIIGNDYNVAMIAFLISISMVLLMNFLADILYAAVDPRIRYT